MKKALRKAIVNVKDNLEDYEYAADRWKYVNSDTKYSLKRHLKFTLKELKKSIKLLAKQIPSKQR